ncbi:MAG: ABC transporter ATP-binding protein [Hyphomicrobiales bacterium]
MLLVPEALTRRYGRGKTAVTALAGASFAIAPGEYVAIMGPSGSGKSTLMNLVGLLDRASSGRLVFRGEDVTRLSHDRLAAIRNRDIGFVFQSYNLLARHTALENVEMPLVYAGVRRKDRARRARAALDAVGLAERSGHGPGELSGGEQQRVAIARALVGDPALVLADEPTGALDSRTGADILALFEALNAQGRTVIVITHDAAVAYHARRIIQLSDGTIVDDRASQPAREPAPELAS